MMYYVDDIMIYSKTYEQHLIDIEKVLNRLRLHVKLPKCVFAATKVEFCGMILDGSGVSISESQKDAVHSYPEIGLGKRKEQQHQTLQFLGLVRFMADFCTCLADISQPLYDFANSEDIIGQKIVKWLFATFNFWFQANL